MSYSREGTRDVTSRRIETLSSAFSDPHLGIAATFAVFMAVLHYGLIPLLDPYPWLFPLALFGFSLYGFLWLIRVVTTLISRLPRR